VDEDGIAGDLLAPEALLRAVLETSADAIFATDGRGRIRTWSAACERLFGRRLPPASLEEGIGLTPPVAAAIDGALDLCRQLLTNELQPAAKGTSP
jgi:PAS domain S-box-containing protein